MSDTFVINLDDIGDVAAHILEQTVEGLGQAIGQSMGRHHPLKELEHSLPKIFPNVFLKLLDLVFDEHLFSDFEQINFEGLRFLLNHFKEFYQCSFVF